MSNKNYAVRPSVTIVDRNQTKIVVFSWWNIMRVRQLKMENGIYVMQKSMVHDFAFKDSTFIASSCIFDTDLQRSSNQLMMMTFNFSENG